MNVSSLASNYYESYSISSDSTYDDYAVDEEEYSEEKYGVGDISETVSYLTSDTFNAIAPVGDLHSFVKHQYALTQLSVYDTLTSTSELDDTDVLTTGNVYTTASNMIESDSIEESTSTSESSVSAYTSSVDDSVGSLIDTLL